jgi:methylenetetrahydrofolate dehydrogenase (NADP+)/methenyltetrahydrofolate cyclohydrolase
MTEVSDPRLMLGTDVANRIRATSALSAAEFGAQQGRRPCLAAVLVGDDPASVTYVAMKKRRAASAGIESRLIQLPASTTTEVVVAAVGELSHDPEVDGILLQHPVPAHVNGRAAFEAIAPAKDVDGVTMASLAAVALGLPAFVSATPAGILRLLDAFGVELAGKHAVVIGRSPILGKPVGLLLLNRDATVTFCHSKTLGVAEVVRSADVVVAGLGRPRFVQGEWIKRGAVVIDAGYNAGNVGDVDFDQALERVSLITPVPGGVGPMTIATLLEQTVHAAFERSMR